MTDVVEVDASEFRDGGEFAHSSLHPFAHFGTAGIEELVVGDIGGLGGGGLAKGVDVVPVGMLFEYRADVAGHGPHPGMNLELLGTSYGENFGQQIRFNRQALTGEVGMAAVVDFKQQGL